MQVLVVRHAIAQERSPDIPEETRTLTPKGRKRMRRAARGLKTAVPRIDILATSPLARARQTSQIILQAYGDLKVTTLSTLMPESPVPGILKWLKHQKVRTIALVGHEPHLSRMTGLLLTGSEKPFLTLKKGGACLLEISGTTAPGRAKLLWALESRQLRRIAG